MKTTKCDFCGKLILESINSDSNCKKTCDGFFLERDGEKEEVHIMIRVEDHRHLDNFDICWDCLREKLEIIIKRRAHLKRIEVNFANRQHSRFNRQHPVDSP